uniref:Male-specific lethal 1 homolog n=1 Tax=Apteryx owenii TaxID=8824 RepID=A0A8B9PAF2_APTOW
TWREPGCAGSSGIPGAPGRAGETSRLPLANGAPGNGFPPTPVRALASWLAEPGKGPRCRGCNPNPASSQGCECISLAGVASPHEPLPRRSGSKQPGSGASGVAPGPTPHHGGNHPAGTGLGELRGGRSVPGAARERGLAHEQRCRFAFQLLARIERMERRVQLVKKDTEREKHRIFQGFEVDEKAEAEACEKLPLECPQELLEPSQTLPPKHFPYGRNGKGHKRKPTFGSAERKTPVKKLVSEFSKVKSKSLKHSPGKEESGGSLSETVCKRELRSQETPEKTRSLLDTPLRPSAPLKGPGAHAKEKGFFGEVEDLPYLSTTEMYLCRWHQPPPSPLPLREPSPKKEETVASKQGRRRSRPPAVVSGPKGERRRAGPGGKRDALPGALRSSWASLCASPGLSRGPVPASLGRVAAGRVRPIPSPCREQRQPVKRRRAPAAVRAGLMPSPRPRRALPSHRFGSCSACGKGALAPGGGSAAAAPIPIPPAPYGARGGLSLVVLWSPLCLALWGPFQPPISPRCCFSSGLLAGAGEPFVPHGAAWPGRALNSLGFRSEPHTLWSKA